MGRGTAFGFVGALLLTAILLFPACSVAEAPSLPDAGTQVIRIELLSFAFAPAEFEVRVGDEVRIVAINRTDIPHEIFLGSPAEQDAHHARHASADPAGQGKLDDGVTGIYVPAGGSAQFTYLFDGVGDVLMGCHLAGHIESGMVGVIHVTTAA